MKYHIITIILTICNLFNLTLKAEEQYNHTQIELLTRKNGLENNVISSILQNRDGFIWLGTDMGFTRYDGVTFHNFNVVGNEPYNIAAMFETENGILWGWANNLHSLTCLNTLNNKILKVTGNDNQPIENIIDFCAIDNSLFAIQDSLLVEFKPFFSENQVILNKTVLNSLGKPDKIFHSENHLIIPTSENKILLYHPKSKQTINIDCSDLPIKNIHQTSNIQYFNRHLWIYDITNGLYCFNTEKQTWKQLSNEPFYQIQAIDSQTFVMATWDKLVICHFNNEDFTTSPSKILWEIKETSAFKPMMQNRISQLYFDKKNNVLWIGISGGLIKLNFLDPLMKNIPHDSRIKKPTSLLQDTKGYIWLTTQKGGIFRSTSKIINENLTFEIWEESDPKGDYCMHKDRFGNIWFGKNGNSLLKHNPNLNRTATVSIKDKNVPEDIGNITHLYYNSRNRLWIASDKGLIVYDHETGQILDYIPHIPERGKATAICEDGNGTMWIGFEKGLFKVETFEGKYSNFIGGYEKNMGLKPSEVLALYLNSYNQLFATYKDKIIQIDGKTKNVTACNVLYQNLSSGNVKCVIDDHSGNTWLGTQNGIITINNNSMESYQFELPLSFYYVIQLHNNQLMWANSNGLMLFQPEQIKRNSVIKKFQISNIEINYQVIETNLNEHKRNKDFYQNENLSLDYHQNNIKVFVTDLLYKDIASKLEYRLLPNDSTWTESYHHFVQLKNMKPGKYTLEIRPPKLTDTETTITSLNIEIKKHWATTGIAIIGYIVCLSLMIYLINIYLKKRVSTARNIREREHLLKEETRKEQEQNQKLLQKMEFHNLLVKEMYNPLSLVMAPLKEILNIPDTPQAIREKVNIAHNYTINLQESCNKLIQFYKEESNDHLDIQTVVNDKENTIDNPDSRQELNSPQKQEKAEMQVIQDIIEEKPESKLKLLIIEDHADIRLYLKVMFAKTYQVLLASNGQEGIQLAQHELPNLIITDVAMPIMDGFECCRLLKEDLKTCHIPIIILTAMASDENIVKGTELGADDYIMKPFNPEILRSKVKNLIKSRNDLKKTYTKFLTTQTSQATEAGNQIKEQDPFIQKVLNIVEENLQNPDFSVKKLADLLYTSQPTLYRKVKQETGYTIIELIRGVRLKRSAELIRSKKYSIQEVAEMVGYNDIGTFRKHFIDHYGTTPSTYNKE